MDGLKNHWLKILCLLIGMGVAWGGLQVQVSSNSGKVEKLETWQLIEEKEGATVSAQLEIVIQELRDIKRDIRQAHK